MMMRHPRPAGTTTQYRHLETNGYDLLSLNYNRNGFDGIGNGCGDGDHLSLYLALGDSTVEVIKEYICGAYIANHRSKDKDWFHTPSDNWGWPRFISLSELDEPETGFLVNGVCVVEGWKLRSLCL
ncbi:hypothetical protein WN943_007139 [Citrus x changshan-huyou]